MLSTIENKENALQTFFNWEKLSKGHMLPAGNTKVQVIMKGERVSFDNLKQFQEKQFSD